MSRELKRESERLLSLDHRKATSVEDKLLRKAKLLPWEGEADNIAAMFDHIAKLQAVLDEAVPDGWQPIETAPKGFHLVSGHGGYRVIAYFTGKRWLRQSLMKPIFGMTHWMPLPPLPGEAFPTPPAPVVDVEAVREAIKLLREDWRNWEMGEHLARAIGDET